MGFSMLKAAGLASSLLVVPAMPVGAQVPDTFVDVASVVEGLVADLRYFGEDNFVGARIDGYEQPRCLLARQAAAALAAVQRELAPQGLGLKVFDCYRPTRAVAHFVRWARNLADVKRKAQFYPNIDKRNLFSLGYIASHSGHSRGATVDLTLVRRASGQEADTKEVDMGSPFDFFSPRSWPAERSVGDGARRNRALLANAMARGGFRPYDKEGWHFTLAREPFPGTYFDFPVN